MIIKELFKETISMSEVKFNGLNSNYAFYQANAKQAKTEEQKADSQPAAVQKEQVSADKVLDAMTILGAQNFANVQKADVDPAKFLSADRISDIESSMAAFEKGVETYASAIKAEFGNALSETEVYSLAANTFALEG